MMFLSGVEYDGAGGVSYHVSRDFARRRRARVPSGNPRELFAVERLVAEGLRRAVARASSMRSKVSSGDSRSSEGSRSYSRVVQSSIARSGTRSNSRVLFVARVAPRLAAWAAMRVSSAPIGVPFLSR